MKGFEDFLKTDAMKVVELFNGIKRVNHYLAEIKAGNTFLIPDLAVQLRSIAWDNNKGKKLTLLNDCLTSLSLDQSYINIYVSNSTQQKLGSVTYHDNLMDVSLNVDEQHVNQITFDEWLCYDIVSFEDKNYPINEIFRLVADKQGGAHYDTKLSKNDFTLLNLKLGKINLVDSIICTIGEVLKQIGLKIIQSQINLHYFFWFGLKECRKIKETKLLFTYTDDTNYYPVTFVLRYDHVLIAKFMDPDGRFKIIPIYRDIQDGRHLISFSYEIREELEGVFSFYDTEGKIVFQHSLSNPLFIYNCFVKLQHCWISDNDFSLGIYSIIGFKQVLNREKIEYVLNLEHFDDTSQMLIVNGQEYGAIQDDGSIKLFNNGNSCMKSYLEWIKD